METGTNATGGLYNTYGAVDVQAAMRSRRDYYPSAVFKPADDGAVPPSSVFEYPADLDGFAGNGGANLTTDIGGRAEEPAQEPAPFSMGENENLN